MSRAQRNFALSTLAAGALFAGAYAFLARGGPIAETPIYRGVTYQCLDFPQDGEVRGKVHIATVDLSSPGVGIYVTPMDETAISRGWEYRLDYVSRIVKRENLAVAINGGYFAADSRFTNSLGDYAVSTEVCVADHRPCHDNLNSYMLWLDDDLTPHVEYEKPPPADSLRRAKWGVSAQIVILRHGSVNQAAAHICDKRTALGCNPAAKKLFLAVFEHASPAFAAELLLKQGATDAIILDGGGSTTMTLGPQAAHIPPGTVLGGWRPVATTFGIRAEPLR